MANVFLDDSSLLAIAEAIRDKLNSTDTYTPIEMSTAISNIQIGGEFDYGIKEIQGDYSQLIIETSLSTLHGCFVFLTRYMVNSMANYSLAGTFIYTTDDGTMNRCIWKVTSSLILGEVTNITGSSTRLSTNQIICGRPTGDYYWRKGKYFWIAW